MDASARFEDWLDTFDEAAPPPPRVGPGAQAFSLPFSGPLETNTDSTAPGAWHLFEHAFAWVPEADSPSISASSAKTQMPPPPPPPIELEAILRELDLPPAASAEDLQRARRRFMWDNHPDRRPDLAPVTANRRVAIANMLIDRALKTTAKRANASRS